MPLPTWIPGQVLTAADVNAYFVPLAVVKTSAQGVTSSATLVNDTDLVLALAANATYILNCFLTIDGASGGDFKWTWSAPSGTAGLYQSVHNEGGATGLNNSALNYNLTTTGFAACAGAGNYQNLNMYGTVTAGSTAGNLQLRWAQQTSNATATHVAAYSHLMLRRVS